jgi:hypothetical protein
MHKKNKWKGQQERRKTIEEKEKKRKNKGGNLHKKNKMIFF